MGKNSIFTHCQGHTCVCFDDLGNVLTGGSDGEVRLWQGLDEKPVEQKVGKTVHAIAFGNDRFFVSTDSNAIQAYIYPDIQNDGVIVRFTAPVTHMDVGKSGQYLVAGSSDFSIKLVDLEDNNVKNFQGHNAPVLSVSLDPKHEFVASSSCDGTVNIWEISTQNCVKSFTSVLPKSNNVSNSKTLSQVNWQPSSGEILAVPVFHEINLYERSSWSELYRINDESTFEVMNIVRFSPCGNYLAAATVQGTLLIWKIPSKELVEKHQCENKLTICSLAWNPSGKKEIAFCDKHGNVQILDNIMTNEVVTLKHSSQSCVEETLHDDNSDNGSALEVIKIANIPDNLEDDADSLTANPIDAASLDLFDLDSDENCSVDFNPYESKIYDFQKPFQPGSTPCHLEDRFMVWNSAGTIWCHNTGKGHTIDIEFHRTSGNHNISMQNSCGYTMAALSTDGAVLACAAQQDHSSKLTCVYSTPRDKATTELTVTMPDEEDIQAVAIGENWMAACTDAQNLRVYTFSGIPQLVISLPGPVVCIAGYSQYLVAVYHLQKGLPGSQCQSAMLITGLVANTTVKYDSIILPLPKRSVLSWIGFTDETSTLCMVDSNGIVSLLSDDFEIWIPVANTKLEVEEKCDNYFALGVNEVKQEIRCVECKGSKYPKTTPRPKITALPFKLPLCELETEKGLLEERFWKNKLRLETLDRCYDGDLEVDPSITDLSMKVYREVLMKLFALSCHGDRALRAYELCQLMDSSRSVQLAIKYAARLHRVQLTERLAEVAREKMQSELESLEKEQNSLAVDLSDGEMSVMEADEGFAMTNEDGHLQENVAENMTSEQNCSIASKLSCNSASDSRDSSKSKQKMTLLSFWMQENRAVFESQHPEASDDEISIMAIRAFRSLSVEEIEELNDRMQQEDLLAGHKTKSSDRVEPSSKRQKLDN